MFSDDFTEPSMSVDPAWNTYWGEPGGDPAGWWDPSHDVIAGGQLGILGYQSNADVPYGEPAGAYVTGGVQSVFSQTYGKYLVRMKMGDGQGIAPTLLLWPAAKVWPPEIDFAEDKGAAPRSTVYGTLHYGTSNTLVTATASVDWDQWHTFGIEWTPGRIVFTVDGWHWATITNVNVPDVPMRLGMQTQDNVCGTSWEICRSSSTPAEVDMDVDWVVAYKPAA